MDVVWLVGAIGFCALIPAILALYIMQFWENFALLPLLIGLILESMFAIMASMYWISGVLVMAFLAGLGRAVLAWESDSECTESATTVEILPWLANSGAFQRSLGPEEKTQPIPRVSGRGRHRQSYIRHREALGTSR